LAIPNLCVYTYSDESEITTHYGFEAIFNLTSRKDLSIKWYKESALRVFDQESLLKSSPDSSLELPEVVERLLEVG
jgi:hypothetical protein